jgi:hypothetical protein
VRCRDGRALADRPVGYLPRSLLAMNVLALNVAPCGSAMTACRMVYVGVDQGASNGATMTFPPSSVAFAAVASASPLAKVTLQCAGVSAWSSEIGMMLPATSSNPSGPCLRHWPAEARVMLPLEPVAVAGQRPSLRAAADSGRLPPEQRSVERPRRFDVGC